MGVSKWVCHCQWLLESQPGLAGAEHSRLPIPSGSESHGAAAKGNARDESSDRGSGARNKCPQGEERLGKQSKSEPHAARCHRWGFQLAASALDHPGTTWVPLVRIQQSEPQVPLSKALPKPGLTRTLLHTRHRGRALTQTLANQEFALCSPKS